MINKDVQDYNNEKVDNKKAKGYTLREFAALANIENSNIARLESGAVNPRFTTLCKLSQALEMPLSELVNFR